MAEFSSESVFALHDVAVEDDASAVASTDDVGNRCFAAVGSEYRIVTPERGCIGIIQVGNGHAELVRQTFADIESRPLGVHKISRTSRTELACGTGRPRSVKADGDYVPKRNPRQVGGDLETICDLLEADFWSLLGECRMLA
jgi:hypothetical protein